jgi:superfamily I DNA and/or RNA helicase
MQSPTSGQSTECLIASGLEFILDQNRLNVALSRAGVLAVVVGDPRIASTPCHTIASMRQVKLYCRLCRDQAIVSHHSINALNTASVASL